MNYLARETLFRFAPLGWLIHSLDAIPIDRDGLGLNGIKESLRRLKRGEMVLIFPEGTRTRDGEMAPFRPGFTVLAARSKAWILPVAIEGAFDAWPRSRKLPRPRHDPCPLRRAHPAGRSRRPRRARIGGRSRAAGPPVPRDVARTPGVCRQRNSPSVDAPHYRPMSGFTGRKPDRKLSIARSCFAIRYNAVLDGPQVVPGLGTGRTSGLFCVRVFNTESNSWSIVTSSEP